MSAKELLQDEHAAAVALLPAAQKLLGDFLAWEPESIWMELQHQGVDVPVSNRAKLMAAQTLHLVPSFYWDAVAFEKTALAFDGVTPNADMLEEASPGRLAWAVVEAAWILQRVHGARWTFNSEPCGYAGVILTRAGFVLAPTQLSFAQRALDRERYHTHLLEDVKARWDRVDKDHLNVLHLEETVIDVQIARLASVEQHVRERHKRATRDLSLVS
jgi:hypothetical protein